MQRRRLSTPDALAKDLLEEARWASTSPDKCIEKWNTAYQKAVRHDINEIKGANTIHDFIQAVGAKFEPTWAEAKKVKLVEYNNEIPDDFTLKSVSDELMRYRKATRVSTQHWETEATNKTLDLKRKG
ncbi:hypothetical protein E4U25_007407 [Claviceps purpurea]|nr:hypothetical protein E4U25_007407 [Claviceps purpurea]